MSILSGNSATALAAIPQQSQAAVLEVFDLWREAAGPYGHATLLTAGIASAIFAQFGSEKMDRIATALIGVRATPADFDILNFFTAFDELYELGALVEKAEALTLRRDAALWTDGDFAYDAERYGSHPVPYAV